MPTRLTPLSPAEVLHEDNHLLVLDKRAGVPTMGAEGREETMVELAADYLREKYNKPGKVFIGVVSRIDRLVSGVLIFARTSKCAARLSQQFRDRSPEKKYLAIVEGELPLAANSWVTVRHEVRKNESLQRMEVVPNGIAGQIAELRYRVLTSSRLRSVLEVELLTGRKHQIRLQVSALGHPILGDKKYGATTKFSIGAAASIALHCASMTIEHPTLKEPVELRSPVGRLWKSAVNSDEIASIGDDWA